MKIVIKEKEIKLNEEKIRMMVNALDKYTLIIDKDIKDTNANPEKGIGKILIKHKENVEILRDLIDDAAGYNGGK